MKIITLPRVLISGTALALLTACGGTPTNPGTGPDPVPDPVPQYETLSSTADATSVLGGTLVRRTVATNVDRQLLTTTGELVHNTGKTTITFGNGYDVLIDPDGVDNNLITDGPYFEGNAEVRITKKVSEGYDYAYSYFLWQKVGDITYAGIGVGGIVTQAQHVPTAGQATYTGKARGSYQGADGYHGIGNATSGVDVDFGSGTVDVAITGFSTNASNPQLIDTIAVTGMNISGNAFTGGTISTTMNGAAVDITGPNTNTYIGGNFFGYDGANSRPDEVAGVAEAHGDNNRRVQVTYIAD
ncbi:MAG: transferrin-binding protein-like solute binding protein [Paracoccaceae bacterium]